MIFVDTGAWFAVLVPEDTNHRRSLQWWLSNRQPLVTTDYVVDETLTLLRARGQPAKAISAGERFFGGKLAHLHFVNPTDVAGGWDVFRRFSDKQWSFTDCVSYAVMEKLKIDAAASFDHHFRQFGITSVVP